MGCFDVVSCAWNLDYNRILEAKCQKGAFEKKAEQPK